jgi:hypothetical protein
VFVRGFTSSGALHYNLGAGFAEVYLAAIDGAQPPSPVPLSPRRAVSNFYPVWSTDGRFVAYGAERRDLNAGRSVRELWVYDTATGTEAAVPFGEVIGRPFGWSQDSREVLVGGAITRQLHVVDRETGRARPISTDFVGRIAWGPAGVLFGHKGQVVLVDPATGRTLRGDRASQRLQRLIGWPLGHRQTSRRAGGVGGSRLGCDA